MVRHNSFPEAARFHGEALFPNLELASLTDAQISYSCFCMYHPSASQRTMNTLRKWLMSTTTPGCVVCWTIKTLPEQCGLRTPSGFGSLVFHGARPTHRRTGRAAWLRLVRGFHTASISQSAGVFTVEIALTRPVAQLSSFSESRFYCPYVPPPTPFDENAFYDLPAPLTPASATTESGPRSTEHPVAVVEQSSAHVREEQLIAEPVADRQNHAASNPQRIPRTASTARGRCNALSASRHRHDYVPWICPLPVHTSVLQWHCL